jgi:tRNA U34 2-thiouridine synthase MnmA/TrmU
LLKRKGYEVVGVFMKNWDTTDEFGFCQSDKEAEEAEDICRQLDMPFHVVRDPRSHPVQLRSLCNLFSERVLFSF